MQFKKGNTSLAVIMITLNEGHNLTDAINQLENWASEVFVLDSFSNDKTVEILKKYNVTYKQRIFTNFGDQWNYALKAFDIKSHYTMKLDPDERLTEDLKQSIQVSINNNKYTGYSLNRILYFMGKELPISQNVIRIWKTGKAKFTDVLVNEVPVIDGNISKLKGNLLHLDSPNLEHWYNKQNQYSTAEALAKYNKRNLAYEPIFFGNSNNRRMWIKKNFSIIPGRFFLLFLYYYAFKGLFLAGKEGFMWSHLRSEVMRMREYKFYEFSKIKKIR